MEKAAYRTVFTADPEHWALKLSLWDDQIGGWSPPVPEFMPCAKCGQPVNTTTPGFELQQDWDTNTERWYHDGCVTAEERRAFIGPLRVDP
jgi:hypothetical protein